MGPPIQIFLTSIASAPALRQRQEHLLRILQVKKIPYTSYDLASDEEAKKLWRRKAPANNSSLPGIMVGGEFAGTYTEFDEAVEFGELDQFFKVNEPWGEEDEAITPAPSPQKPIGVPGVATPLQMTGQKPSFSASPSKPPKKTANRTKSIDVGTELGFGLEGVKVSQEEMLELVESLGLGGDDADDLVKGLGLTSSKSKSETTDTSKVPVPAASSASKDPTPTTAISTSSETAEASAATTVTPSDANTPSSKDQVGEGSSATEITEASKLPSQGATADTKDTATKAATSNTAPDTAPQVNVAAAKDLPTGETSPKAPAPESASGVAPSNDDTQIPSATNDEKSAAN